jgi:ABC-type uncharacterized transport system fused permease/ATPase subunit
LSGGIFGDVALHDPHLGAGIVSIGHRSTLIALHRRQIEMEPGQGGVFEPTPTMGMRSPACTQP